MIGIIFNFKTKSNKNLEFMQAIGSIMVNIRKLKRCVRVDFQQDAQDKDQFTLQLDWQDRKSIKELLESQQYFVLEGAIKVLCEPPVIEINDEHSIIHIDANGRKASFGEAILDKLMID